MKPEWSCKHFDELTGHEIYAILQLRNQVFVVEQNCVYQDADNKDKQAFHLSGWIGDLPVAYCRILGPGVSFNDPAIGRVATSPAFRHLGYGRQLMELAIPFTLDRFASQTICISAQLYLRNFYESFGFVQTSETYQEDDIPHIRMQYSV